jgi:hypothetical protein
MRKFSDTLKSLARSLAVAGLIGTAGVAVSTAPAVAQMHGGGGGGFHGGGLGGGGFHGGGFHGGGFHGSSGGFRGGVGGFRGDMHADRGAFRGGFHRGGWVRGRWFGPGWAGWYGVDADPYDNPYGCSYYDYYYGYCDY